MGSVIFLIFARQSYIKILLQTMKLIYASLGALSAVSAFEQLLFDVAERVVNQFVREIDNGFEVHFGDLYNAKVTLVEDFEEGKLVLNAEEFVSFTGEDENTVKATATVEVSPGDSFYFASNLVGNYDDVPDIIRDIFFSGLDVGKFESFNIHEKIYLAFNEGSAHWALNLQNYNSRETIENLENKQADADVRMDLVLETDAEMNENSGKAFLTHKFTTEQSGSWPDWFSFPEDSNSKLTVSVDDFEKCVDYFNINWQKGVHCQVDWNYDANFGAMQINPSGDLSFKQAIISFNIDVGMDGMSDEDNYHSILLRAEIYDEVKDKYKVDKNLFMPPLYSLYYINGAADIKARRRSMKKQRSFLVLRLPGIPTINGVLIPHLDEKFAYIDEFSQRLMYEGESVPHLIYYFDKLHESMTDEFDLSKFIELSRINTDAFPLNDVLQEIASDANDFIINDIFGCPWIEMGLTEVRGFVSYVTSEEGLETFNDTWAQVFQPRNPDPYSYYG